LKQLQERLAASEAQNSKLQKQMEEDREEQRRIAVLSKHKV
jgi:hypothetical protein